MKNLEVWKRATRSLWNENSSSEHVRVAISSDCPGLMFVCVNLQLVQYEADGSQKVLLNVSNEVPSVTESNILELVFFSIQRLLCLFLTTGEIITINVDSKEVIIPNVEEFCYQGLKSIGVSPDQEIVVILTNDNQLLLFDSMFNVINKTELYSSNFGEGEFITVGWGKKETQFHGSEGKQAAHKKNNFESNIELDNDKSCITWRGDGSYFAVGFVKESQSFFKVYNREGILQYTSEKQASLECMYIWRPTGNLIATTQIFPNKYVIAFFEKNGLRHGELVLPFKQEQVTVKSLSWSGDSEILSIWYINNESKTNHILLYTINNYHWYLKQSLIFEINSQILFIIWEDSLSDNNGKCLHIISNNGLHNKVEWIWSIDQSIGKGESDDATVAVIDGNKILLTNFRYSVVPPPMAANVIECDKNVNKIIFGPVSVIKDENGIDSNSFFAIKEDGSCDMFVKENNKYKQIGSAHLGVLKNEMNIFNAIWLSKDTIVWIESNSSSVLYLVKIVFEPHLILNSTRVTQFEKRIIGIKPKSEHSVILQSDLGELFSCSLDGIEKNEISFPENCYKFDITYVDNELFIFGLTNRNRFFINDVKIANNINSYFVHSDFLLLTTLQHQLLSCPLKYDYLKKLQNGAATDKSIFTEQNENCFMNRKIERGAYLVTVVSCDTRTVLQLPRGNLEIIQPRALSLKIVEKHLNNKDYHSAFDLMRKQRINLNLIYDHNPEMFVENINVFINNINNTNWLSLFISELDDQDVTQSMYLGAYGNERKSINKTADKVKTVCSLMRKELEKINKNNKYILPILTTYVKNNTIKDLENALLEIKCIKQDDEQNVISANDALKYLLYMVNVDELFNIALGLYDFELVMFVANKSQKDPKEYVPYINKLKSLEENYRKFTIDNDLKRYESALQHLINCGEERSGELLIFIKQHCLYSKALNLIANDDLRYKNVAQDFGGFLESKRHFTEAGMMYLRCGKQENALKCFTEALEWQTAIDIAHKMEYSEDEIFALKRSLLNKLKEVGRYSEIIDLITDSPNFSVEDILKYALEGKLFKLSLSVCHKHHKENFIDALIRPAIREQYENLLSTIDQNTKQFDNQKNRLLIVRQNKAIKATNEDENMVADCDLYSDTSSIMGSSSSKSSGRSHRSSKNRRKHERKMASLKEGSRFEDVALVRALFSLVSSTFDLRKDIKEIGFVLHWLSLDCEIKELQGKLDALLNEMTKNFNTIWIPELNIEANKSIGVDLKTQDITTITDASFSLEPHIRIPPVIRELKWKIEYL